MSPCVCSVFMSPESSSLFAVIYYEGLARSLAVSPVLTCQVTEQHLQSITWISISLVLVCLC